MGGVVVPQRDSFGFELSTHSPYASKKLGENNLFARNHGIQQSLEVGQNIIEFIAPYPLSKITGVEVINGTTLDKANFKVYQGETMLNQFAYDINIAPSFYQRISRFDADFVSGLKIIIEYTSVNEKTIGINFIMDEVKQ